MVGGHGHPVQFSRTFRVGNGCGEASNYVDPHVPADWTSFSIRNVHVGSVSADFQYRKTTDRIVLDIMRTGSGDCVVEFSPAFSLRTQVTSVETNGRPMPFKLQPNSEDQHLPLRLALHEGSNTLVIRVKNDFGLQCQTICHRWEARAAACALFRVLECNP